MAHVLKISYVENKLYYSQGDFPLPTFICIIATLNNKCRKLPYMAKR